MYRYSYQASGGSGSGKVKMVACWVCEEDESIPTACEACEQDYIDDVDYQGESLIAAEFAMSWVMGGGAPEDIGAAYRQMGAQYGY